MDELDECLQSMATEKEEAMKQATMAEKHNAEMEETLRNVSTQLEVSLCFCLFICLFVIYLPFLLANLQLCSLIQFLNVHLHCAVMCTCIHVNVCLMCVHACMCIA